jgi:hypothetical protein
MHMLGTRTSTNVNKSYGHVQVTKHGTFARCGKCGASITQVPLRLPPISNGIFARVLKVFINQHKECKDANMA